MKPWDMEERWERYIRKTVNTSDEIELVDYDE